ncbi:MAG: hypothetical protein ACTIOQ_15085 [Serratia grimesii]|uniref:hypothetical protein n=1 Tax=Serratia grimesii TaxID=82995 RepID=UPI003F9B6494
MKNKLNQPVAEIRYTAIVTGGVRKPGIYWFGKQYQDFPAGTKFYTTPPDEGAEAFRDQMVKYVSGLGSSVIARSVVETILSAAERSKANK